MATKFIDLHTHSTISDGTDLPEDLIQKAAQCNISVIALTDHDSINGIAAAKKKSIELGLGFIPGCEISAEHEDKEYHFLTYWLPDPMPSSLQRIFLLYQEQRKIRNLQIIKLLNENGVNISLEEVSSYYKNFQIGRPHFALTLIKKGYVQSFKEAFVKFLGKNGCAFVKRELLSAKEIIQSFSDAGTSVFFAHPFRQDGMTSVLLENTVKTYAKYGLEGIEAYHSGHSTAEAKCCAKTAKKFSLVVSGGSDYHGAIKPNVLLGQGAKGKRISFNILEQIIKKRKEKGLPVSDYFND